MTAEELSELGKLRDELHAYHIEVKELVTRCEACRAEIIVLKTDIYGVPGNKDASPGLLGEVADLRRGRRVILVALSGAWVVFTILLAAVASAVLAR